MCLLQCCKTGSTLLALFLANEHNLVDFYQYNPVCDCMCTCVCLCMNGPTARAFGLNAVKTKLDTKDLFMVMSHWDQTGGLALEPNNRLPKEPVPVLKSGILYWSRFFLALTSIIIWKTFFKILSNLRDPITLFVFHSTWKRWKRSKICGNNDDVIGRDAAEFWYPLKYLLPITVSEIWHWEFLKKYFHVKNEHFCKY